MDIDKIEDKLDKVAAGAIAISEDVGGIKFESMMQVMEFAKLVSISAHAVPKHLRGEPGACLGIVIQALEWRFSPYFVANKSFLVNDRLAYEAQLLHAVVLTRAPIKNQEANVEYTGEGDERQARVWVELKSGGIKDYTTPKIGKINPKNSPLWKNDPDQQLFYFASRSLARRHFPHVLGGVYSKDELEDSADQAGPEHARDITPKPAIGERLKGAKGRGFSKDHVDKETAVSASVDAGTDAGEQNKAELTPAATVGSPASPADPLEELLDTKVEPEPDPRAEAFNAGEAARDANKPLQSVPEQFKKEMALSDAYQDGWRDRDKQMAGKAA